MFANTIISFLGASLILLTDGAAGTSLSPGPPRAISSPSCLKVTTIVTTITETSYTRMESGSTSFSTITTTTTVALTTATALPPADFTPIRSQIAAQGYSPSKRDLIGDLLGWLPFGHPFHQTTSRTPATSTCNTWKTSATVRNSRTTTSTPASFTPTTTCTSTPSLKMTPTRKATSNTSTLKTIMKPSSFRSNDCLTTTLFDTIILTSTVTNTDTYVAAVSYITTTSTASVPVATHYAACDPANQLSRIDSVFDINPDASFQPSFDGVSLPTPYDCCVAAIKGGYAYSAHDIRYGLGECRLFYKSDGAVCRFNATTAPFYIYPNGGQTYTLSNGYCGSWRYAGVEGDPSILPPKPAVT